MNGFPDFCRMEVKVRKERKEKIAVDIINCASLKEVCQKNKISAATLYRLRQELDFKEILNQKRIEMYESALNAALSFGSDCVIRLMEIVEQEELPATARVNAAKVIIEMCSSYYDNAAILARIEELEEVYRESQAYQEWE